VDLLTHAEAHGIDGQVERLESREQLGREQRQLLRPLRGRDVDREHAGDQAPRLGAARHAVAQQASPAVAIDDDFAALGRDDARSIQELADHLGA
jgi:hypothetical protein